MANIPDTEPGSLRVGDTWKWTKSLADYPASAWTLKYRFKSKDSGFEVVASASGSDHSITVAASTTSGYTAGDYTWTSWVENGSGEKYTVGSGASVIEPDYRAGAAATALDDRSHPKKMLDAIEAWMESRDPAVAEYELMGRKMKFISPAELVKLRYKYQAEVKAEEAAARLKSGLGVGRKIQFRL